jgi:hypothetical protein
MSIKIEIFCDALMANCPSRAAGTGLGGVAKRPSTVCITVTKMLENIRSRGWVRVREIGWVCPQCQGALANQPPASVIQLKSRK